MATTSREQLKAWFRKGLKPLESQFAAWLDSYWHKSDSIPMSSIDGLNDALNDRTVIADDTLDTTSANPICNKAVATALQTLTLYSRRRKPKVCDDERRSRGRPMPPSGIIATSALRRGTGGELIQEANMLGAATITRILTRNVARLFLTNDQGVRQEISLTGTLSIAVPADDILTWEIARTNDDELACVGIKCELTAD